MRTAHTTLAIAGLLAITLPLTARAQDPRSRADDTWITIEGTVGGVSADEFQLDYGDGTITVEMDDGDRDADAYRLEVGDAVTVSGVVDSSLFEATTIEAGSVHVERLDTTFRSSTIDDEDLPPMILPGRHVVSRAFVQGTITSIGDSTFTLDRDDRAITVSVEEMSYDPLDDEGFQQLRVGDRVIVTGAVAYGLFEGRRLFADRVTVFRRRAG